MQETCQTNDLNRYCEIKEKNKREIVLLRGFGCSWKKCTFCDYHLDYSLNEDENISLNKKVLKKITGKYFKLEVINSGSFIELPSKTIEAIKDVCLDKNIKTLHFESHYINRKKVQDIKKYFAQFGIKAIAKIGIETFDFAYREKILKKGIVAKKPEEIAKYFDECCLLQGLFGQNEKSMAEDIEIGLKYFQRVCINIMQENTTNIKPDNKVVEIFINKIYPLYKDNQRVDILLNNTDFGVGEI